MNRIKQNIYWFDFSGLVNEKLPLPNNVLKACRGVIDNTSVNTSTKENPIKLKIEPDFGYNYDLDEEDRLKGFSLKELYNRENEFNCFSEIQKAYHDYNNENISIYKKIIKKLEFYFEISSTKENINHFYLINNSLYITYRDFFLRVENYEEYLDSLNKLNAAKLFFLYRNYNYDDLKLTKIVDNFLIKILLNIHLNYLNFKFKNKFNFRLKQTNWGFYLKNENNTNNIFLGLKFIWVGLKYWIIGLSLSFLCINYLIYVRLLPFNKIIFSWILLSMFLYWLISGFVFFIKKYQYSKFTSVIQRFWKRTYILFWLIEACTFSVFFYLTLNATSEPIYMYDQIKVYKTHLFSWRWFLIKIIPSVLLILIGYYILLSLKWNIFNKQSVLFLIITFILLYMLWLEFYQFYHIINFFGNINWIFDYDEYIWNLDISTRRTRLANNYIAICLLLKFWHFVFIFLFWIFFVLRINELNRARYPLLVANIQNFIIIYIMSWVYMYPWFKFIFKKYLDIPYYWFYTNGREIGFRVFFTDIKLFFYGLINRFLFYDYLSIYFNYFPFYYWINSTPLTSYEQYRKNVARDAFLYNINNYIL